MGKTQETKKALGRKVRKLREKRKFSLSELSEKSGVGVSQISKYEKGKAFPSDSNLIKIAQGLRVTVSELVPEKSHLDMPDNVDSDTTGTNKTESAKKSEPQEDNAAPLTGNEEVYYGEKTKHFVDALITVTRGFSDDPLFIAAERLLLEAFFGYRYIIGYRYVETDCMLDFAFVKNMLLTYTQDVFSGEKTIIDEAFEEIADIYDENFAVEKYTALKSQLCVMPELKGIFFSCAERLRKMDNFISVYTDMAEFLKGGFKLCN